MLQTAGNTTTNGTALLPNATAPSPSPPAAPAPSPPALPTPPPPETAKEKIEEKWQQLESGKSTAEQVVAITIGSIMLLSILTCLVCCVFRRGGQWRVPGLQWFKAKFGRKDTKYSRYMDSNDDGF